MFAPFTLGASVSKMRVKSASESAVAGMSASRTSPETTWCWSSYRAFSRRAGLRSPNYLKLVIDGQRNLTPEMAERFAEACSLENEASTYFCDLVAFNQARTASARNAAYARLTGSRHYKKTHRLDLKHAAYFSTWYLPAIRELAARPDFREDDEWIAHQLVPPITRAEVRRAIDVLLDLSLLVREDDGNLKQGDALLSTGPETRGMHIANYHRTMMSRAAESIDLVPAPERDISSLTLCLGEGGIREMKERLKRFRRELLELSELEDEPRQVVQINFQLFPLSRGDETEEVEG